MLEYADGVYPIEIKAASTFDPKFASTLGTLAPRAPRGGAVVLGGGQAGVRGTTRIVPWTQLETHCVQPDLSLEMVQRGFSVAVARSTRAATWPCVRPGWSRS